MCVLLVVSLCFNIFKERFFIFLHVLHVMCYVSQVTCYMSNVTNIFFLFDGGASLWIEGLLSKGPNPFTY